MEHLYCDGGCITPNPSASGGTWAWIGLGPERMLDGVLHRDRLGGGCGIITPADIGLPTVSNNISELMAALQALEAMSDGWAGILHTDSWCTLSRLVNKKPGWKGVPAFLQERTWRVRKRLGAFKVILLDGHPSKAQLLAGIGKRGNPVSVWNQRCDEECTRLALEWKRQRAAEVSTS